MLINNNYYYNKKTILIHKSKILIKILKIKEKIWKNILILITL